MNALLFGPAGIPLSANNRSSVEGIKRVKELGLGCMELEFVRGVRMTKPAAMLVGEARKKHGIELTAHGPYYINLNSDDKTKRAASRTRILQTARIGWLCGASSITFHAAYYIGQNQKKVYDVVKRELKEIIKTLNNESNKIWIRPELTGKPTQFGDLNELIMLSQELDQVMPCVDYAHYHARYNGKYNNYKDFADLLKQIEKGLGKKALENVHIHISGIQYSSKGERNHLNLKNSDMNYQELVKAWKDYKIKGVVISESPNLEGDAILLKQIYET
ncbi:hypothetical protein A3K72_04080 [Candidatus Woesearchaeota archaeon RBG_13_36_6]|nr:MAG: hypothetical protein A3K72_04080 [Candidatus Woesearchaeota archaeon RBG_13_36_6]